VVFEPKHEGKHGLLPGAGRDKYHDWVIFGIYVASDATATALTDIYALRFSVRPGCCEDVGNWWLL
jgi:hypothetical protein